MAGVIVWLCCFSSSFSNFSTKFVQGQFRPYSRGIHGVAAVNTVALYHVLRVVFLADGDGPFLTVAGDCHAEDSRHVTHVGHLEPVHGLFHDLVELVEQSLVGAEEQNVINIERQGDDASLVAVDVHARIRLERKETNDGKLQVHRPCQTSSSSSVGDRTSSSWAS